MHTKCLHFVSSIFIVFIEDYLAMSSFLFKKTLVKLPPPPYNQNMAKLPNELTPETLIKRVMSGTKEYRSQAYLEAFSKLSSNDLHSSSDQYSHHDIITLWNSLHSFPNKVRYFTFSLVRENSRVIKFIESNYTDVKWAYICHDKDNSSEHKHFHYVLMFSSPRSFSSVANDLEVPVTMLQKVYSKRGILDYLTHENDPNKHHYDFSEIHANFDIEQEKKKNDSPDLDQEFHDYCSLRNGVISLDEWWEKYKYIFCDVTPSERLKNYDRIFNASCTGASLSSRAEFRVPNPCSKNPIQTAFSCTRPEQISWIDHGSTQFVLDSKSVKPQKKLDYRKPNPRSDLS